MAQKKEEKEKEGHFEADRATFFGWFRAAGFWTPPSLQAK